MIKNYYCGYLMHYAIMSGEKLNKLYHLFIAPLEKSILINLDHL